MLDIALLNWGRGKDGDDGCSVTGSNGFAALLLSCFVSQFLKRANDNLNKYYFNFLNVFIIDIKFSNEEIILDIPEGFRSQIAIFLLRVNSPFIQRS